MDANCLDILARGLATSGRRPLLRRLDGAALGLAIWQSAEDYERTIHRMPLRMVWGSLVCSSN
jgi:hypothetical protein